MTGAETERVGGELRESERVGVDVRVEKSPRIELAQQTSDDPPSFGSPGSCC